MNQSAAITKLRQDAGAVEVEEPLLLRSDLVDMRLIKVGLHMGADRPHVLIHVVATDDVVRDYAFGDQFGGLLEVFRGRQHLNSAAASNQRPEHTSRRRRVPVQVAEWRDSAGLPVVPSTSDRVPQRPQDPQDNPDNRENYPDCPQYGDPGHEADDKQNDSENDHSVLRSQTCPLFFTVIPAHRKGNCSGNGHMRLPWPVLQRWAVGKQVNKSEHRRSITCETRMILIAVCVRHQRPGPQWKRFLPWGMACPPPHHSRRFLCGSDGAMQPVGRLRNAVSRRLRPALKQCAGSEMRSAQAVYHGTASCEGDAGIMSSPIPEREHGRR